MELRPYQRTALDGLYSWFQRHPEGNPLVAAAVGAGKSVMIAALCQEAISQWPETRIVMCVPSKELCEQNLAKLLTIWPEAPASVYSAAMGRKELGTSIVYATIGSIYKIAHQLGRVDLLLIDECHLLGERDTGMYRTLINDLISYCPDLRTVGLSGTIFRGNGIYLTDQEAPLFHGVAASVTMRHLLDTGYLAPLTTQATATKIATEGVGMRSGDYIVSQLAAVSDQAHLVASACQEIVTLAAERKRWLVFAVTVEHAQHIQQALSDLGIACAVVSGVTPKAERQEAIADFRSGKLRALVNVAVLTTGFDVPEVDCIALLRATKSPVLYTQILGRGMRIAPDKADCLVLDFTDTIATLGPVDAIKGRAKPLTKGSSAAPYKVCPECGSHNATALLVCLDCGYEFPPPERINHGVYASNAAVLSSQLAKPNIVRYPVDRVTYHRHVKPGSPDSMRVEYWSGLRVVAKEWVCFEHGGMAGHKAKLWWKTRLCKSLGEDVAIPSTTEFAIAYANHVLMFKNEIINTFIPKAILVNESGKFPEITSFEWAN